MEVLLHQLESTGVDEAKIIETLVRAGRTIPKKIWDSPDLNLGLQLFYRAFFQLNSCRYIGVQEGPIPWTAICMWCDENEITGRQRRMTFHNVRAMDNAYMKFRADKIST